MRASKAAHNSARRRPDSGTLVVLGLGSITKALGKNSVCSSKCVLHAAAFWRSQSPKCRPYEQLYFTRVSAPCSVVSRLRRNNVLMCSNLGDTSFAWRWRTFMCTAVAYKLCCDLVRKNMPCAPTFIPECCCPDSHSHPLEQTAPCSTRYHLTAEASHVYSGGLQVVL